MFDETTVIVCPTGHANIHYLIRRLLSEVKYYATKTPLEDLHPNFIVEQYTTRNINRKELAVAKHAFYLAEAHGIPWEDIL